MSRVRTCLLLACTLAVCAAVASRAAPGGDKKLLGKYKKQNQQQKQQIKAEVDAVLKKAKSLEARQPQEALELVRAARDNFIREQVFTAAEERELFQPLADRMAALKEMIGDRQFRKLGDDLYDYKESIRHWADQFEEVQKSGVSTAGGVTVNTEAVEQSIPALVAFRDGTFAFALLRKVPGKAVDCTIESRKVLLLPTEVAAVKIAPGYFLYHESLGRFAYISNAQAYILTAPVRSKLQTPELPPPEKPNIVNSGASRVKPEAVDGYVKAVFAQGPRLLPVYLDREKEVEPGTEAALMRQARDALIDAQIRNYLARAGEERKRRFKTLIVTFLNNRPGQPLNEDQEEQLLDEMERAMPNAAQWPRLLLNFVNDLVQENRPPRQQR